MRLHRPVPLLALVAILATPAAAAAQSPADPPPNDAPGEATSLAVPSTTSGETNGATRSRDQEPPSTCGRETGDSLFYAITAPRDGRVVVELTARGDLDATVDVLRVQRSQRIPVTCDATDANGRGGVDFQATSGTRYLIRVAALPNSRNGSFSLGVFAPQPAARPPGRLVGNGGVTGSLDRIQNPDDAFSRVLRAGVPYRVALTGRGESRCRVTMRQYAPGISSFASGAQRFFSCGSYAVITPRRFEGGRYSFRVQADRSIRSAQRFHLEVRPATQDDLAPGLFLRNYARITRALRPTGSDFVDVYRFDVVRRSRLDLSLRGEGDVDLLLSNDAGRGIRSSQGESGQERIRVTLRPGRYFATVRAGDEEAGRYRLRRVSRIVTRARVGWNASGGQVRPGRRILISTRVSNATKGAVRLVVDRFDPNEGWRYFRTIKTSLRGGQRTVGFRPPSVGRYRVQAFYLGSRGSAADTSGFSRLLVAGPLRQR